MTEDGLRLQTGDFGKLLQSFGRPSGVYRNGNSPGDNGRDRIGVKRRGNEKRVCRGIKEGFKVGKGGDGERSKKVGDG